jgi:hypothetical protein
VTFGGSGIGLKMYVGQSMENNHRPIPSRSIEENIIDKFLLFNLGSLGTSD